MSTIIEPTVGRIVWYRHTDGAIRAAIVVGVNGTFNLNLFVFGYSSSDLVAGMKDSVAHADPDVEPGCLPSWHWMPYQKQQAEKHATEAARADEPKMPPAPASQQPAPGAAHAGYSMMQPHQQRVVDERAELDGKLAKLNAFIDGEKFSTVDPDEQELLKQQAATMAMYSDILTDRITAFAPADAALSGSVIDQMGH